MVEMTFVSDEEKYNIPFVDEWMMREEDEIIRFEAKDILIIPVSKMFSGSVSLNSPRPPLNIFLNTIENSSAIFLKASFKRVSITPSTASMIL